MKIALAAALLLLMATAAFAQGHTHGSSSSSRDKDYSFKARDIESGQMLELDELIEDKPLILHVWAPDCPHCQRHMPYLASLYKKLDMEKVNFVTYSVNGSTNETKSFLDKRDLEFPTVCLSNGTFSKDLKDGGWPNTLVIGIDGKLIGSCDINGPSYVDTMMKLVEKAEKQYEDKHIAEGEVEDSEADAEPSWFED